MDYDKLESSIEVHSQRCHSWLCPVCREKRGRQVRAFLRECSELFEVPKLFTLTVNPSNFLSPLEAYRQIRDNGYIPRLMRFLGVRNWFAVLEFQKNGFPHWHLLIDVGSLPRVGYVPHFLDLEKVYSLWRDKWKFGSQIHLSEKHTKCPEHAVNYICKYLIKPPSNGYPEWVWNEYGLRFFSASKSLGSVYGFTNSTNSNQTKQDSADDKYKHKVSNCLRVVFCGSRSFATSDGRFLRQIDLPLSVLMDFDCFKLSQSDGDEGLIYSSVVMDKHKASSFFDSLSVIPDDNLNNFALDYALHKAKQLGIEDIYNTYAIPF